MKRRIMIVGAGFGQLIAIQTAKEMGLEVVCIDRNANAKGMGLADFPVVCDTVDIQRAIRVAKEYEISGVLTIASDVGVPAVCAINEKLNLVGPKYDIVETVTNKLIMRQTLKNNKIPCPEFAGVTSPSKAISAAREIGFPVIVKPPSSSGSRGVTPVNKEDSIEEAFFVARKFSKSDEVCVEKYLNGIEMGAQTFSHKGIVELILVHNDTTTPYPKVIPVGHSYPSYLDNKSISLIEETCEKAVLALGITEGPSNVDILLTGEGPHIIEVGARIGATCLPELTSIYTNINYVAQAINCALGSRLNLYVSKYTPTAGLVIGSETSGILAQINIPSEYEKDARIKDISFNVEIGQRINKFECGADRIGQIIVTGDSAKEAEKLCEEIKGRVNLVIE